MKSNKAISTVTATIMFILVVVGGYVFLQNSLYTFTTQLNSEYDAKTDEEFGTSEIKQLSQDGTLYFKNSLDNSLEVQDVKVEGTFCSITEPPLQTGVIEINISSCLDSYSKGFIEVTLLTNRGVFSREVYYNSQGFQDCTGPDSSVISHGENQTYYNYGFIPLGNSSNCDSQVRVCNDGTLNGTYTNSSVCQKELALETRGGMQPYLLTSDRFNVCSAAAVQGLVVNGDYVTHSFDDYGGELWDYCTFKNASSIFYFTCEGSFSTCGGTCDLMTNITCS